MLFWFLLLFAVLQGLLEWLPVSSEGQSVTLLVSFLHVGSQEAISLSLWLHLGTLIAVVLKYYKELFFFIDFRDRSPEVVQWRWFILLTTFGTAITGIPCYLLLSYLGESSVFGEYITLIIGIALLVTAFILYFSRKIEKKGVPIAELSKKRMLVVGLLQGFTIIPGISRSGTTVGGLLFLGVGKEEALKGSFIMSIPAVLGGFTLNLSWSLITHEPVLLFKCWEITLAILVTAIVGFLTIELLLRVAKKYSFAFVCLVLGLIIILFFLLGILL